VVSNRQSDEEWGQKSRKKAGETNLEGWWLSYK